MMKFRQSRRMQSESGQAMVEFAMTITITLLLIFGLIEFGRAVYTASIIQWAAQSGARAAIIDESQAAVEAAVKEKLLGLDPDIVVVAPLTWSGNVATVNISYEFRFIVPIISNITGESIELNSSASMIAH